SGQTRRLKSDSVANLSRREQEVLDSLLENLSNKEIASKLNIAERTVKFHVSNLLNKFGVRRRADLILLTFQRRMAPEVSFFPFRVSPTPGRARSGETSPTDDFCSARWANPRSTRDLPFPLPATRGFF